MIPHAKSICAVQETLHSDKWCEKESKGMHHMQYEMRMIIHRFKL